MANGYNRVCLRGKIIIEPILSYQSKMTICTFKIEIENHLKEVDVYNCVCNGKLAEIAAINIKKNDDVLLDGIIQVRKYTDDKQIKHWITEILVENIKLIKR
jgi:single-stranded DNA-binding protein